MQRFIAAALVALASIVAGAAPTAAQECADFGSRKAAQQQLEQAGDPAGALDPDADGYACEDELVVFQAAQQDAATDVEAELSGEADDAAEGGADAQAPTDAEQAPTGADITIQADGPAVGDDASGTSGGTVSAAPGVESATQAEGEGNSEEDASDVDVTDEGVSAGEASASEGAATAGDAAVTNDETGETAVAGEAEAVDTDAAEAADPKPIVEEPKAIVEEAEPVVPAPEASAPVVAPAPIAAAPAAPVVPVQLPNTGAGVAGASGIGVLLAAVLGFAAIGAAMAGRRFARG
ncbi:MAG: hypothetical protein M3Q10_20235 [Chloroflexota bacterium]|nr:hypothetical protein [Chloroflexota bacterium]